MSGRHRRGPAAAILGLFLLGACGDSGGPGAGGASFGATLDGLGWQPDTSLALIIGSATDTTLVIVAGRVVSPLEEQDVTLHLEGFRETGTSALGDTGTASSALFSRLLLSGGQVTGSQVYLTGQPAGVRQVTGFDRTDSVITGSFSFEAATTPDTAVYRRLMGQFRLRWTFQQVFTP